MKAVRFYHNHKVIGMGHIPQEGPALIVVNHSLATYDITLLFAAIYEEVGRFTRPLADNLFFRIPYLSQFVKSFGGVCGNKENAKKLLRSGELVSVAPGGMKEALRFSHEKYKIIWNTRKGFIKIAIEMEVPIILAMCPMADDIYKVYSNPITSWVYDRYRVPLFCARGIGPTAIPKPVKLRHYLSKPLYPPKLTENTGFDKTVDIFHKKVIHASNNLIAKAMQG